MKNRPINEAINYFKYKIAKKDWHDNFADPKELREKYYAMIIAPYGKFSDETMKEVVNQFKHLGWNCKYRYCYDARGKHKCFYIAKKHF